MNRLYKAYLYLRKNANAAFKAIFRFRLFHKLIVKPDTTIFPSVACPVSVSMDNVNNVSATLGFSNATIFNALFESTNLLDVENSLNSYPLENVDYLITIDDLVDNIYITKYDINKLKFTITEPNWLSDNYKLQSYGAQKSGYNIVIDGSDIDLTATLIMTGELASFRYSIDLDWSDVFTSEAQVYEGSILNVVSPLAQLTTDFYSGAIDTVGDIAGYSVSIPDVYVSTILSLSETISDPFSWLENIIVPLEAQALSGTAVKSNWRNKIKSSFSPKVDPVIFSGVEEAFSYIDDYSTAIPTTAFVADADLFNYIDDVSSNILLSSSLSSAIEDDINYDIAITGALPFTVADMQIRPGNCVFFEYYIPIYAELSMESVNTIFPADFAYYDLALTSGNTIEATVLSSTPHHFSYDFTIPFDLPFTVADMRIRPTSCTFFEYNIPIDYNVIDSDLILGQYAPDKIYHNILVDGTSVAPFANIDPLESQELASDVIASCILPFTVAGMDLRPDTGEFFKYDVVIAEDLPFTVKNMKLIPVTYVPFTYDFTIYGAVPFTSSLTTGQPYHFDYVITDTFESINIDTVDIITAEPEGLDYDISIAGGLDCNGINITPSYLATTLDYDIAISGVFPFTVKDMQVRPESCVFFRYDFDLMNVTSFISTNTLEATADIASYNFTAQVPFIPPIWDTFGDQFSYNFDEQTPFIPYVYDTYGDIAGFNLTDGVVELVTLNPLVATAEIYGYNLAHTMVESFVPEVNDYTGVTAGYNLEHSLIHVYSSNLLAFLPAYFDYSVTWTTDFTIDEFSILQIEPDYWDYYINIYYNLSLNNRFTQYEPTIFNYDISNLLTLDFTTVLDLIPCEVRSLEFVNIDLPMEFPYLTKAASYTMSDLSVVPDMTIPIPMEADLSSIESLAVNYIDLYLDKVNAYATTVQYPSTDWQYLVGIDMNLPFTSTLKLVPCEQTSLDFVNIDIGQVLATNYVIKDETAAAISSDFVIEHFACPKVDLGEFDRTDLYTSITDSKIVSILPYILNGEPLNLNSLINLDSIDINSYFIYCTFAKLIEYRSSTNTLGSMGGQTMTELSYHKHNY